MSDFDVEIDKDGNATAKHRVHGHEYEFHIIPEDPFVAGGTVRQNQTAERDYAEFAADARNAVLKRARESGLIPKTEERRPTSVDEDASRGPAA